MKINRRNRWAKICAVVGNLDRFAITCTGRGAACCPIYVFANRNNLHFQPVRVKAMIAAIEADDAAFVVTT
jgi:hypothetical protein